MAAFRISSCFILSRKAVQVFDQVEGVVPNQSFPFFLWRRDEFRHPATAFNDHIGASIISGSHRGCESSDRSTRFR